MRNRVVLGFAFSAVATFCLGASAAWAAPAAKLDTGAFSAACAADSVVTEAPGLEAGSKVTPKMFCDCVVGKYQENKLSQKDVDMLTKVHKDELTDDDAAKYPTLEDLLSASEGYEDACKKTLGLPADTDEEAPGEDDSVPEDTLPPDDGTDQPE
jgi:hypothetical protein